MSKTVKLSIINTIKLVLGRTIVKGHWVRPVQIDNDIIIHSLIECVNNHKIWPQVHSMSNNNKAGSFNIPFSHSMPFLNHLLQQLHTLRIQLLVVEV